MKYLLPIFVTLPIIEMWLLIEVGTRIGAAPTILLVLATAMIGLALLRQQGFATLLRANRKVAQGEMPAIEVAEGLVLAVGGALLLTPGFVTDAFGFACLLPVTRRLMVRYWLSKMTVLTVTPSPPSGFDGGGKVIDGEFKREEPSGDSSKQ